MHFLELYPLAHGSKYYRRGHGLWPKRATFLAWILYNKIFETSLDGRNGLSVHAELGIIVIENYNYNFNYVSEIKSCNSLLF